MKSTAADNQNLSFKIDPDVVFVNTKPQQQAFVNIKVEITNNGTTPLQVSAIAIILPETITTTPKGVVPAPDDPSVWNFQLSTVVKNQFEAKPVKTLPVTIVPSQTTIFYLQTVKLVKTIATDLVQVTVKVNVVGQTQVVKLLDVDVQSATASIENFSVTPATIKPGTAATLSWDCKSIDNVIIEPGVTKTSAKDTAIVSPLTTTLYTLYAYGKGVILFAQLTVAVKNVDVRLTSNMETQLTLGDMVTLEWTCNQYVENAKLSDNKGIIQPEKRFAGNEARHNKITVGPVRDLTTFKFSATADETVTRDSQWTPATIMVDNVVDVSAEFSMAPAEKLWVGDRVTLSWDIKSAKAVSITPAIENGPSLQRLKGSAVITLTNNVTYNLEVDGFKTNQPVKLTRPIAIVANIVDVAAIFKATPGDDVWMRDRVKIEWDITNPTKVTLTPAISGGPSMQNLRGSFEVVMSKDETYTLIVEGHTNNQPSKVEKKIELRPKTVRINKFEMNPRATKTNLFWDVTAQIQSISKIGPVGPSGRTPVEKSPSTRDFTFVLTAGTRQNPDMESKMVGFHA